MNNVTMVNRRALIIHNADGRQEQVLEKIQAFLRSNHGGAWEGYEITVAPSDCSETWLEEYFRNRRSTSYYLLFYIGRKYIDERKGMMYCLPSGEAVSWMWLRIKTKDVPTLLITDCCWQGTDNMKGGERRNDDTAAITDDKKRKQCRKMYDEALEYQPWGVFVTASSDNMEEPTQEQSQSDGIYLGALFEATEKILTSSFRKPGVAYSIDDVHRVAAKKVRELSGGEQTPSLKKVHNNNWQFPFLVKMRKRKITTKRKKPIR